MYESCSGNNFLALHLIFLVLKIILFSFEWISKTYEGIKQKVKNTKFTGFHICTKNKKVWQNFDMHFLNVHLAVSTILYIRQVVSIWQEGLKAVPRVPVGGPEGCRAWPCRRSSCCRPPCTHPSHTRGYRTPAHMAKADVFSLLNLWISKDLWY